MPHQRDQTRWRVGLTIDPKFQKVYWTQEGPDNAGLHLPADRRLWSR